MKRKTILLLLVIIALLMLMTSCADVEQIETCVTGKVYGFWNGLWHGLISPFAFIGSLFNDEIAIYAVNNNGGWYDFGFILGIGSLGGGSSASTKKR